MADHATLMAYLVPRLTRQAENAAIEALGYILHRSPRPMLGWEGEGVARMADNALSAFDRAVATRHGNKLIGLGLSSVTRTIDLDGRSSIAKCSQMSFW